MPKHFFPQPTSSASVPFWVLPSISVPKMKNRASTFLKHVFSAIVTMVKAKSMAMRSKTSTMKAQILIFGLLRNKKVLMSASSHKLRALTGKEKGGEGAPDYSKAIVLYNAARNEAPSDPARTECDEGGDGDYPDLTHSLFDLEDEDDGTGSVIDLVKNSREDGADFSLEDEIDHVADVFIRRFHKQMRMQKLESFKRYQEMLERSV